MNDKFSRSKEILEFCLRPLISHSHTQEYKDSYARLEHVIKTYQSEIVKNKNPIIIDFSQMRTLVINEDAHGDDN